MNFSQHSKINSSFILQDKQKSQDHHQRFVSEVESFQNHKFIQNQMTQKPQRQSQFPNLNHQKKFIPAPSAMYGNQLNLSSPKSSFYEENLLTGGHNMQTQEPLIFSDEEVGNIEYFQCTPSQTISSRDKNPFKHVMDSMQHFTKSKSYSRKSCPHIRGNHQTFCFKHEDENEEVVSKKTHNNKTYQSHTSIEKIPKGLKIITWLLTDESDGEECEKKTLKEHSKKKEEYCVSQDQKAFEDGAGDERN